MTVQIVEIAGQKIAMLPAADYERLLEVAEDMADIEAAERAEKRRLEGEEYIPFSLIDSIINGENALRVWRKYRNMTIDALAGSTGVRSSMISMMENGKAQGKPTHWRSLAEALGVDVEDILPQT
jgi:DNA-binding XRE family transcriptional regulator